MFLQARFYLLQYSNFGTSRFAWKWWSSFSFRNKNIFGYKEQNNSWMINAVEIWGKSFLSPLKNHMANCSLHTAFPIMLTQYNIYLYIWMYSDIKNSKRTFDFVICIHTCSQDWFPLFLAAFKYITV